MPLQNIGLFSVYIKRNGAFINVARCVLACNYFYSNLVYILSVHLRCVLAARNKISSEENSTTKLYRFIYAH